MKFYFVKHFFRRSFFCCLETRDCLSATKNRLLCSMYKCEVFCSDCNQQSVESIRKTDTLTWLFRGQLLHIHSSFASITHVWDDSSVACCFRKQINFLSNLTRCSGKLQILPELKGDECDAGSDFSCTDPLRLGHDLKFAKHFMGVLEVFTSNGIKSNFNLSIIKHFETTFLRRCE